MLFHNISVKISIIDDTAFVNFWQLDRESLHKLLSLMSHWSFVCSSDKCRFNISSLLTLLPLEKMAFYPV